MILRFQSARDVRNDQRGAALVVGLLLATSVAMIAVHTMSEAALGLRMAGNLEYRDRAAEAAEFGILHALAAPGIGTGATLAQPFAFPANDDDFAPVPGCPGDEYSYRVHFAGSTAGATGVVGYHFVVESTGRSLRGARVAIVQGFRIDAPPGADSLDGLPRRRTYWVQLDAD